MKLKSNALMALAAITFAGGAHAALTPASTGDGSLMFVAVDNIGSPISLQIDLGFLMSDFVPATSTFDNAGTTIVWNFATNTRTVNGLASSTGFAWSGANTSFLATAQPGDVRWGVVAGDSINGGSIPGRGFLVTGNPTGAQMAAYASGGPVGNGLGAINNSTAGANNLGTHPTDADGANTATSGATFVLNTSNNLGTTVNTGAPWGYLTANGATSTFQYVQQLAANPDVYQIGVVTALDALADMPSQFSFDAATSTLTFITPVPEPSTYAMLLAGMGAIGAMVRRRRRGD